MGLFIIILGQNELEAAEFVPRGNGGQPDRNSAKGTPSVGNVRRDLYLDVFVLVFVVYICIYISCTCIYV